MAWQLALMIGASTAVSYMGSLQQTKHLKAAAAWDKYHRDIKFKQDCIVANKKAAKLLSEKRAAIGARGVQFTGSTLMEQCSVVEDLEDALFWANKGLEMDTTLMDVKLAGALNKEAWDRNMSLLDGASKSYTAWKT